VLDRISDLTSGWPAGFELDLNPVRVLAKGAVALDAAYTSKADVAAGGAA
jgi:hypothetical protein